MRCVKSGAEPRGWRAKTVAGEDGDWRRRCLAEMVGVERKNPNVGATTAPAHPAWQAKSIAKAKVAIYQSTDGVGRDMKNLWLFGLAVNVAMSAAIAQDAEPAASNVPAPAEAVSPNAITLPALTLVELEILAPLNSKTSKIGEMFPIRLAEPIMVDGKTIVPAGAIGQGEIIHAAKARAAGKAGEMILAARYIEHGGQKITLRSFKYGTSTGKSNRGEAFAAGAIIAAPLTLLIAGGNVDIPTGTLAHAKTSVDHIFKTEGVE